MPTLHILDHRVQWEPIVQSCILSSVLGGYFSALKTVARVYAKRWQQAKKAQLK